jgi:hypothetical protein
VNEELLRDTLEVKLLVAGAADVPSRPTAILRSADSRFSPSSPGIRDRGVRRSCSRSKMFSLNAIR